MNGTIEQAATNGISKMNFEHREGDNFAISNLNVNAITNNDYTYEKVKAISDWLLERVNQRRPKIAIVCGSGLGGLGDRLKKTHTFPYSTIPDFPRSTVQGHKGNLIFGELNGVDVVCMQGRFHAYEGYSNALCTMPIKVFKLLGVETVILTCAAGGINQNMKPGDIMLIKDHLAPILWTLQHPLVGHNDDRFGPRFPPTNRLYLKTLRDMFRKVTAENHMDVHEGVYASLGGPHYESIAELRVLSSFGVDAVGMSIAHEAIVAGYCGMQVLALALITNSCILEYDSELLPNHEEVIETANRRAKDVEELVSQFVEQLDKSKSESQKAIDSNNNLNGKQH